ncbi:MAG TPA: hypothetical protein PKL49_07485 [Steroidobacteraceae bacterium]|nr:hypothetical protein [Steroidobacteraceae bacterium]HNS28038.1 hypothetical protein [Steroidobacteraceae bacterium]
MSARPVLQRLLLSLGLGFLLLASAEGVAQQAAPGALEVFVRDGCPHCDAAKSFLVDFAAERPDLRIVLRPVEDPRTRDELVEHFRRAGAWPPAVPTFVYEGRMLVGFDNPEITGAAVRALVGPLELPPRDEVPTILGGLSAAKLGLPLFTLSLGLLDGFNPCAMWVLLFLLSLLVRLRDRRRMAIIAGTFVLVSGAVYYAFMAAWLNLFLAIGMSNAVRWTLAGIALLIGVVNVKDFVAPGRGVSLSIPEAAKPGLYARARSVLQVETLTASLIGVAMLAVLVNFVELLCTAGLPAIFTAVLAERDLSTGGYYAYLGLYIAGYIADDALMVTLAVLALGNRRLTQRTGRWLKLLSGVLMLALGAILFLRPQWLS